MHPRISLHQAAAFGVGAVVTSVVHLGLCVHAIGGAWQRNEGDRPPVSP